MNPSTQNTESEIAHLRKRVAELEAKLQNRTSIPQGTLNAADRGDRNENLPSLSLFLNTAIEQKNILEAVLESVDIGVIVANRQAEMIFFNSAAGRILGCGPVNGVENWATRYGFYDPETNDLLDIENFPLVGAIRGRAVTDVKILIRNDQAPGDVLVVANSSTIRDSDGNLNGGVLLLHDITKSHADEIELTRRSAAITDAQYAAETQKGLLESILNNVDIAVTVSNKDGEFVFFNPAAHHILGVGPVSGVKNWTPQYGIYRPDRVTPYPAEELPLARALRGETVHDDELYIRNPGKSNDILLCVTATPFSSPPGDFEGAVCIFRDITEKNRSQRTLEMSEERFRAFMENLPAIAFIKNTAGKYIYGNHAFFSYHDTTANNIKTGCVTDFDLTERDSAERIRENDAAVFNGRTPLHVGEHLIKLDKTAAWFSVHKFRLSGPSGEPLLGGIAVDVTERRGYARRLEDNEKLLRNMIELQEKERLLVAHDIHDGFVQDVIGAKMLSETIQGKIKTSENSAEQHQFDEISSALARAITDARRLVSELRPLVIDDEGVVAAIRFLISEKRYAEFMKITFIPQTSMKRFDPLLEGNIFRIVQEALNNTERHSEAGAVSINLRVTTSHVKLSIRDDGIGFNPTNIPTDRFGLRGMRERVRIFGGDLHIHSTPGEGTAIEVSFPLKK
ncbi:MAG: PAS domain-containing protein [Pirellulales bacterium]|nr:PAS domain-containing protein [Pirellulales bacterium]